MTDTLLTFDGGTPGQPVVAGTNGVATIMDGAPVYAIGQHGAASIRTGSPTNTVDTRFKVNLGLSGDHYGSIYLRNTTAHGSGSSFVNFFHIVSSTNAFLAQFRVAPSNGLSIRVNNVEVRSPNLNEIPVDSWFRMDWQMVGTTLNWKIFYNSVDTVPNLSGSVTTINGPATGLILGAQSSASIIKDWSWDTVRASNSSGDWLAPYLATPPVTAGLKVWNGSAEVPVQSIAVWNGSTEVPVTSYSTV